MLTNLVHGYQKGLNYLTIKLMKLIFSLFLFLISIYLINGQDNPVKWDIIHNIEHQELEFKATIDNSWHLYAVHSPNPNEGPLPTEFNFSENEGIKIIGSISESKPISVFDANFGVQVSYFETKAIFKQKIEVLKKNSLLEINIDYMVCNEHMCIPFNDSFKLNLTL